MFFFESSEIVKRLKKYPILEQFSEFTLNRLVDQSEIITLGADEILFRCDEPSDSVYYLVEGDVEYFLSNGCTKKVASIRSGEMVGEMGVISGEKRALAAKTTRESQLLKISQEVFLKFFQKDTGLLMILAQNMAKRLRNTIMGLQDSHYPYKNIGLIVMSPDISVDNIKAIFHQEAPQDQVVIYDKKAFDENPMELVPFFYQCEDNPGINLFFSDNDDLRWNNGILDYVDYIYLLTHENSAQYLDADVLERIRRKPCDIVILHAQEGPYSGTEKFYLRYPFKRHHHIMDRKADAQRLYRFMTGQAIGLVISGGGFRGYAHHGLIKALFEAKIPIDCIAGSSMGAAVGAILALKLNWESFDKVFAFCVQHLKTARRTLNLTLPILSLLSGKVATRLIKRLFKKYRIEDLSVNFFCVVSNLSESQKEIKKTGALWEWIRATISIPGVFPPFAKKGLIYIDGAACTNLPVLDMREYLDCAGKIISCDLHVPPFLNKKYKFPPIWNFKRAIAFKLGFLKSRRYVVPKISDILIESSLINQSMYDMQGAQKSDIIISPDTSSVHFSDVYSNLALSHSAYEIAKEKLKESVEIYRRWII